MTNKIINITEPQKKSKKTAKKKLLMISLIIILVVGVGAAGWFGWPYLYEIVQQKNTDTTSQDLNTNNSIPELTTYDKANQAAANGNYTDGQKILDDSKTNDADDTALTGYYVNKAILAVNYKYYAEAIDFAKKADEISKSRLTSRLLGQIAVKMGDTKGAIEYYQLTIDRYSEDEKISEDQANSYNEDLLALQELKQ